MINKRLLLTLLTVLGGFFFTVMLAAGPVGAQEPDGAGEGQPSPEPSATPVLELTTAGWLEVGSLTPAEEITTLALAPVDCAAMSPPVVGFEISRGQTPDDVADFINDLTINGFSVGTVDISGGVIPPCVDVLLVKGSVRGSSLASAYTAADGALLKAWTSSGHGLMLSGEFGPFRSGTEELFLAYGYSQQGLVPVSDPTDSDPLAPPAAGDSWVIYQTNNFASHPILNGVNALELLASSSLTPNTNAIVTTDAVDANPPSAPVMAAFADGPGCVALITDSNWNSVVVVGATVLDGYFKQDNAQVARQMVQWLNGCISLKLSKVAVPSPVQAGGLLTYTLTASNDSATAVTNVVITDTMPLSTTFFTATEPFVGPDANGVVTWSLGALNPNSSITRTLVVTVDSAAPLGRVIANTAWVTSTEGLSDTATTFTPVNVQVVDPRVSKAVNTSQAQIGDVVTFTLTVSQTAPSNSNATNVQVVDSLPNEIDLIGSPEVNAGFTQVAGRVVTWTIPVLAPADVRLMAMRVQVNNSSPPPLTIRNQATLKFDQGADRPSNLVELLVPALAPTATPISTPKPPGNHDDDDDDDESDPAPPTATPVPATSIAIAQPAAPAVLPVTILPETGSRAVGLASSWIGSSLALLLVGAIGVLRKIRSR